MIATPLNATDARDEILLRLNCKQLPVLPPGVGALLKSLTDENISFPEMALLLERYPSIAAKLIAIANSAWSSPAAEITTLEQACSRLGFNVIRSICIALAVAAPFDPKRCQGFDARFFWTTALLAADAASLFGQISRNIDFAPTEARAGGLLHNLGLLLIADQAPQWVQDAIREVENGHHPRLMDALNVMPGFNYCDTGKLIGEDWALPTLLIDAMSYACHKFHNDGDESRMKALMRLTSRVVSDLQRHGESRPDSDLLASPGIDGNEAQAVITRLEAQLGKTREMAEALFG